MKLAKVLPAMAALVVLSACASDAPKMENKAEQMATPTVTDKTVVYTCNKKTVTAVYQFENQEPTAAMVMVGNKVVAKDFARDAAQKDFTSFTSGKYVWNVDSGLTLDKFDSVAPVNLLIKGKKAVVVLAHGGIYKDGPADLTKMYMQTVLNFIGITDVEFVYAEGIGYGPDVAAKAVEVAKVELDRIAKVLL